MFDENFFSFAMINKPKMHSPHMIAFTTLLLATTLAQQPPTCAEIKSLYQHASIQGGGTGCCGNDDKSLDIPTCDTTLGPFTSEIVPARVPSQELINNAVDMLPNHTTIEKLLPSDVSSYPFGDSIKDYMKACSYFMIVKSTKQPLEPQSYTTRNSEYLTRYIPQPDGTLKMLQLGGTNTDRWGVTHNTVTRSLYKQGMIMDPSTESWVADDRYNTWILSGEQEPLMTRWDDTLGGWSAGTGGTFYAIETYLNDGTMTPVPERSTYVCKLTHMTISLGLPQPQLLDLRTDNGMNTFFNYATQGQTSFDPDTMEYGLWDDTDLGPFSLLLIQGFCKWLNPRLLPASMKSMLAIA
jgi:hypothetical protein